MIASFAYHEPPDVPPGMTLAEYRRARAASRPHGRRRRWRLRRWRRLVLRRPPA
jgi:hypothetical protein